MKKSRGPVDHARGASYGPSDEEIFQQLSSLIHQDIMESMSHFYLNRFLYGELCGPRWTPAWTLRRFSEVR